MQENYLAFYTTKPFWAGAAVDFSKIDKPNKFTELMSEIAFSYKNESYKFEVCKDGMIMIQIKKLEDQASSFSHLPDIDDLANWWSQYLNYANCLNLLLDSSMIEIVKSDHFNLSEITINDAIRITFEEEKMKRQHIASESLNFLFQMLRYPAAIPHDSLISHTRIQNRIPIQKPVFDLISKKFSYSIKDESLVEMLSEIAKSIAEFKIGNYPTSIVLSWFVIESVINGEWKSFLKEKNTTFPDETKRINKDRKDRFMGRDYPISVIINVLELSDILPFSLFRDVDTVRGYRNNVVHQDKRYLCKSEHCSLAINTALKLALKDQSLTIKPNLSYGIYF